MTDNSDVALSKSLSRILRHRARKENLLINQEGYVAVAELLKHRHFQGRYTVEDIKRVVSGSDKQRFTLRLCDGVLEICANQGHSIEGLDKLDLVPLNEPGRFDVIHGTYFRNWTLIKVEGLSRMSRNHIHFAKGLASDKSVISGMRSNCQVFIYINLKLALDAGIPFYTSANGVILSPGNRQGNMLIMDNRRIGTLYYCGTCSMEFANKKIHDIHKKQQSHQMKEKRDEGGRRTSSGSERPGIYIRGYAKETKEAALVKYFSQFGHVVWAHFGYDFTLLDFEERSVVEKVLSKREHFLHGRRLIVKYKEARNSRVPVNEEATVEKTFQAITNELKNLNDFELEFACMMRTLQPVQDGQGPGKYHLICQDLYNFLSREFCNVQVHPFGSTVTGLDISNSDIDVFLANVKQGQEDDIPLLQSIKKILNKSRSFGNCFVIASAKVPLVKCIHLATGIKCDINVNNMLGVFNSQLIHYYMGIDPKVRQAMLIVKYWAKCHKITGQNQLFSNYALTMMMIFFLQQNPYCLPSVESMQQAKRQHYWNIPCHWNPEFVGNFNFRSQALMQASALRLVEGFFEFYAQFPYDVQVICPYLGKPVLKAAFKTPFQLPPQYLPYKKFISLEGSEQNGLAVDGAVCVQDPFEHCRNVASAISMSVLRRLVGFCRLGREMCTAGESVLYKLLTEKPPEFKRQPFDSQADCFEVIIHSALPSSQDWFQLLTEFLQLALKELLQMDVNSAAEDSQTSNCFTCSGKFNMWDARKSTAKRLKLSGQKLPLVERERAVTQHLKVIYENFKDVQDIVNFQLTVTQKNDYAVITVNKLSAYKKTFKSFAQFFVANMAYWFELYQKDSFSMPAK